MSEPRFINRELAWLQFNQRVLDEALDPSKPLLDRTKFLAITASNLDEFFMVRVGALKLLIASGRRDRGIGGTPTQQLRVIRARAAAMQQEQARLWNEKLQPALAEKGIRLVRSADLQGDQRAHIDRTFRDSVLPLLTPVAADLGEEEQAGLVNLTVALAVELVDDAETPTAAAPARRGRASARSGSKAAAKAAPAVPVEDSLEADAAGASRLVLLALPRSVPRFVSVPYTDDTAFVLLEDLIEDRLDEIFPGERVLGTAVFRVTRNGDIALRDEDSLDLAEDMEDLLFARTQGGTVRLEFAQGSSRSTAELVRQFSHAETADIFRSAAPLDLKALFAVAGAPGHDQLRSEAWPSVDHPDFDRSRSIFEQLAEHDMLLHHPYQRFEPVVSFLEQAAADPQVLGIKQILYRTAADSRIVDALIQAAEAGKQVTVLVELKARFDEARNLARAEDLRRAGAQILYGVRGLKTHAKITLVLRSEGGRIVRYCHFGTGNYNESTAKLYTDISLLTARPELGQDASGFFNAVAGRCKPPRFSHISAAPATLKPRLLELLEGEIEEVRRGGEGLVRAKLNSLQDPEMIEALYRASQAGVKISLMIRGVCCLKPGVKGLSENIRVMSVVDQYLEHSRIIHFRQGGRNFYAISSADWMTRNLDKRVELMVPVEDKTARKRLDEILTLGLEDTAQGAEWGAEGEYRRLRDEADPGGSAKLLRSQEELSRRARRQASARSRAKQGLLEPHLPKE